MSSHLPYVIPGEIVPGPLYHVPRAGYTRKPISNDPIQPVSAAVPDIFKHKAEEAGKMRLQDDNLVKVIQNALQKQTATTGQTQSTDKQAMPSDLSWRTG
jgi:hypothetical protein